MSTIGDVTDQDFEERVLRSDKPVLIDFWAEWCVPCHMVSPVVEEIARDHAGDVTVGKLNVDDNPETARRFGVLSIPDFVLAVFVGTAVAVLVPAVTTTPPTPNG